MLVNSGGQNSNQPGAATGGKAGENASGQSGPAPCISLPKGGGAIKGTGEKLASNPMAGTGSMSVPLAVTPGRSGFLPHLARSYDSDSGNEPLGVGWNLSFPTINCKTDKGPPKYEDV